MAKPITPRKRVRAGQATMVSAKGKKTIFDYYNDSGLVPAKDQQGRRFKNFEEFKNAVQTRTTAYLNANPEKTPQQALNFVLSQLEQNRLARRDPVKAAEAVQKAAQTKRGTIYKGIPFKINPEGVVDFNKRKYMSDLPQPVYDYIVDTRGEDVAKEYRKAVKKEWEDMGAKGREFKGKTGVEVHRGHWLANKFGAAESARAGDLEIAMMNVLHGADPRGNIEAVKESSRSSMGWLDDFYEWDLVNNKLNVPGSELLTVEDLQGISADEVDVNQRIAQRLEEQRMGTLPEDRTGNLFGSEVREGETLEQAKFRKKEEQARYILETNYNPQSGNPASKADIADAKATVSKSKAQMRANPVGPRGKTQVIPSPGVVERIPTVPEPIVTPQPIQPRQQVQQEVMEVIPRGVKQNGGKVKFSGAARRATKLLPIVPAVLGVGEAFSQAKAGDLKAAQATLAETAVGEVPVVGDILVSDPVASGTLEGAQQQAIRAQQPKSAVAKIIDNPLNELKYIGKQGLRGIKKIGGAILFGY
ncbi:hypothetical protein [Synechococcus phage S-B28]|uniref:Uncharacterized protein n=1 Tax=Synechococcus phage S-B28 TaxID=2545435 RepID=A0A482IAK9_9CAUD|nr:hypothetical protein HOV28_gp01 [Synechococcus phage S-B28]QBP05796.1 hypothetical protein [Synechococcus phage S-B28]